MNAMIVRMLREKKIQVHMAQEHKRMTVISRDVERKEHDLKKDSEC